MKLILPALLVLVAALPAHAQHSMDMDAMKKKMEEISQLMRESEGFSGAEIEQAVVSAMYAASAAGEGLMTGHVADELSRTRPLSVVMRERIDGLRAWAAERTVPAG